MLQSTVMTWNCRAFTAWVGARDFLLGVSSQMPLVAERFEPCHYVNVLQVGQRNVW